MGHGRALVGAVLVACALGASALIGCGGDHDPAAVDAAPADAAGDAAPSDAAVTDATCTLSHVVYLNRAGGTYTPGQADDSSANVTWLLDEEHSAAAYDWDPTDWTAVVECFAAYVAAYDVQVTDVDPGSITHQEIVLANNTPEDLGFSSGILSIGPSGCQLQASSIAFVFLKTTTTAPASVCNRIGFQFGLLAGLEPVSGCSDLMSGVGCDEVRSYTDTDLQCSSQPCACGGTTRNSHQTLLATFGPNPCG